MTRQFVLLGLLAIGAVSASSSVRPMKPARQELCAADHRAWVTAALKKMQAIKPGMTRAKLLEVFTTEGVPFRAVGRPSHHNEGTSQSRGRQLRYHREDLAAVSAVQYC